MLTTNTANNKPPNKICLLTGETDTGLSLTSVTPRIDNKGTNKAI